MLVGGVQLAVDEAVAELAEEELEQLPAAKQIREKKPEQYEDESSNQGENGKFQIILSEASLHSFQVCLFSAHRAELRCLRKKTRAAIWRENESLCHKSLFLRH